MIKTCAVSEGKVIDNIYDKQLLRYLEVEQEGYWFILLGLR
ncbi:MAG: hypothetical protein ACI4JK_10690 [Oscillospiraceae bacterium]